MARPMVNLSFTRWAEGAVAATLSLGVATAAQERGRARDLEATAAELLAELGEQEVNASAL